MTEENDPGKKGTQEETVPELESDQHDSLGYSRTEIARNPDAGDKQPEREQEEE